MVPETFTLCGVVQRLEEAKEALYDVYNALTSNGDNLTAEMMAKEFPFLGKRDLRKIDNLAYWCWERGSEVTQIIERVEAKKLGAHRKER